MIPNNDKRSDARSLQQRCRHASPPTQNDSPTKLLKRSKCTDYPSTVGPETSEARQPSSTGTPTDTSPRAIETESSPSAKVQLFRPILGDSISTARIDAHIPKNTNPSDREIVKEVMDVLPPRDRQFVEWFHVHPGKPDYKLLPNQGLIVVFNKRGDKQEQSADISGLPVLYYEGHVQPHSYKVYISTAYIYLYPVMEPFDVKLLDQPD